jgi:adenylate cyclase
VSDQPGPAEGAGRAVAGPEDLQGVDPAGTGLPAGVPEEGGGEPEGQVSDEHRAALARTLARMADIVLGDPVELTRGEVAGRAGLTVDEARPYWRAMGFADVGDRVAFTRTDLQSLQTLVGWVQTGVLDEARAVEVVRSLGQTASRLADWQVGMMARILAESEQPVALEGVVDGVEQVLPEMEALLVHAWRRHLAAVIGRGITPLLEPSDDELANATVGFADIAGFTRLARVLSDEQLAAMVESFETGAADVLAGHGARLVKTLGDEVMFVADGPDVAVSISTALHHLPGAADVPLRLRIGLATGRVVSVMGDYYGETANRASRLTAVARPGQTLVDAATEEGLSDPSAYLVRHHRPRALRGLGRTRTTSVRMRHDHRA